MDIEQFIENKQRQVVENKNFLKWNKDNKLLDDNGYPIISFHGSTNNDFNVVDIDYSKESWGLGKGFYTSDSIVDVNANYATGEKKPSKYMKYEEYTAGDLRYRISSTKEEAMSNFENEEDCEFFSYSDIEDYILETSKIDLNILKENPNIFNGFKIDEMLIDEDNTIEVSELISAMSVDKYVKNSGWVKPVFIKMKNPVFFTIEEDATKITISDDQLEDFMDQYNYEYEQVLEMVDELAEKLTEYCDQDKESIEDEIKHEIQGQVNSFCEDIGQELYDCLIDYVEVNFSLEDEEVEYIVRNAFNENNLGEYNEEEEIMEFESVVIFDMFEDDDSEEQKTLYKNIKQSMLDKTNDDWTYNEITETFQNFENKAIESGEQGSTLYNLFKEFRYHENEPDLVNYFNDAIKDHFDGIVLDAIDANEKWRFDNIGNDTRHYILFDKHNIKSAIGNNGDYSITDPNIAARRSREKQHSYNEKKMKKMEKRIQEYNDLYDTSVKIYSTFTNSINFEEDAIYNRDTKTVTLRLHKIKNTKQLSKVIAHEVVGHAGLDLVLGKNKDKFLDNVAKKYIKDDYKHIMKLYPEYDYNKKEDKRKLTEEKICYYAEKKFKHDNFMNKVVNKIRNKFANFKKKLGLNSANDDIFEILYKANQQLQQKRKKRKFF